MTKQRVICGYCKDCVWRIDGYCYNSGKIDEDYGQGPGENDDRLRYDYMEDGCFKVGANFGCVHFKGPNDD